MLISDQIWYKPNENSNSIGHLILHLCGNARQWICGGIGRQQDNRIRYLEFTTEEKFTAAQLKEYLETLALDLDKVLDNVTEEELIEIRKVQVYEESVLSILIHVIEHFSYHTGQITYITKMLLDRQTDYYANQNLEINHE